MAFLPLINPNLDEPESPSTEMIDLFEFPFAARKDLFNMSSLCNWS